MSTPPLDAPSKKAERQVQNSLPGGESDVKCANVCEPLNASSNRYSTPRAEEEVLGAFLLTVILKFDNKKGDLDGQ